MDGSLVEPDWAPLSRDEIDSVLSRYPELERPFPILTISPRPFSSASVVAARNQDVFVKRHATGVRDAEGLCEEHRFMAHLARCGVPVPRVFMSKSGETAIEEGVWTYEVHTVPCGVDAYEDAISWTPLRSAGHAHSAGRMLARLHLAAEGYTAPERRGRQLVAGFTIFAGSDPAQRMEVYVDERPALNDYLSRSRCHAEAIDLLRSFHVELAPLLPHLSPLWTHNDLHASNLFWTDETPQGKASAVIDFGLCDRTNAVHDLAHAIERNIVEWLALVNDPEHRESVPVHMDHLWAMLQGYEAERPLSAAERAALAPMLALCHAEFALSEAEYFLTMLHSREKAHMACEGYLLSHAQWWHGPGAKMLDEIRAWARAEPNDRKATTE
ncbi:MAG TPA: phosphotransferase [Terracidiphilus sp.]